MGGTYPLLEVHVLDFAGEVYGRQVQVEFVQQLRDERRFDGLDALRAQIDLDVRAARAVFDDIRWNKSIPDFSDDGKRKV